MFSISLHLQKHTYAYLLYNNVTNTTLAQDVFPYNTICYITNGNIINAHFMSFKLITHIYMNPNVLHQSDTFGGCGLKLASLTVRFIM
jgi:hypothetical protein